MTILFISTVVVGLVGLGIYMLGLLDRPKFEETTLNELYLILATTTKKDIGMNVLRLLTCTRNAIETIDGTTKVKMIEASMSYGAPKDSDALSVGLYFDDPQAVNNPRWGIGWAINVKNFDELKNIEKQVQKVISNLDDGEVIRAVKIGGKPGNSTNTSTILKAQIPWRHMLTPMIAPMLHWKRAFTTYKERGYKSTSGRDTDEGAIACEVYVTAKNCSRYYIDYIVLMGNTKDIFDNAFPL